MSIPPDRESPKPGSYRELIHRGIPVLTGKIFGYRRGRGLLTRRQLDSAIDTARKIPATTRSHDQPDSVEQHELDTVAEGIVTELEHHLGPHASQDAIVTRRGALRALLAGGGGALAGESLRRTFTSEDPNLSEYRKRIAELEGKLTLAEQRAVNAESALESLKISSSREIAARDAIIGELRDNLTRTQSERDREKALKEAAEERNRQLADRIAELEKPLEDMRKFETDHAMPDEFGSRTPSTAKHGWRIRAAKPTEKFIDQPGREVQNFRTRNRVTFPSGGFIDGILRPRGIDVLSEETGMTIHPRRNSRGGISPRIDLVTRLDDKGEPAEIVTFTLPPGNTDGVIVFEKTEGRNIRREVLRFVNPQTEGGYFTARYQSESTR